MGCGILLPVGLYEERDEERDEETRGDEEERGDVDFGGCLRFLTVGFVSPVLERGVWTNTSDPKEGSDTYGVHPSMDSSTQI